MQSKSYLILFISLIVLFLNSGKSQNEAKEYVSSCLQGKIKYPFKLRLFKIEGKVRVVLKTNENGYVDSINVIADYFGKSNIYKPFTNPAKIENLRAFLSNKLIPIFTNCVKNHQFDQINYSFEIPISFGIYGFEDDYTIYDYGDYEYEYEEQFDYRHEYD